MSKNQQKQHDEEKEEIEEEIPVVSLCDGDEGGEGEPEIVVEKPDVNKKRIEELYDSLARVTADYENYRRRNQEATKTAKEDGIREIFSRLLPVLDAVELAKKMIKDQSVLNGLELIQKQFGDVMAGYGVSVIEATGKEFDPNLHNAVHMVDDPENAGKVVGIFQNGYIMRDKVIRHANVIIAK